MPPATHKAGPQFNDVRHVQIGRGRHPPHVHDQGIQLPLAQLHELQFGGTTGHGHLHARVVLGHVFQPRRHQHGPRPRTQPHPQAAHAPLLQQRSTLFELLCFVHDAPRPLQHRSAQRRQFILFAHPVDQGTAQVVFQHLDAATQCRLGDVQLLGRTAERTGLCQGQPMRKVLEVHVFIL